MGFFNRLLDFGDREQVRTAVMKIDTGIQQIKYTNNIGEIRGISFALKQEVEFLQMLTSKLTHESLNSLDVKCKGGKVPYYTFLDYLREESDEIVKRGGFPII